MPYITGLAGGGTGYFADNNGNPRMVLGDAPWQLPGNAGRWNSGNWQADFDGYCSARGAQGYTVIYTKPIGSAQSGGANNTGGTFDGLFPFQGGTPSTGVASANPSTGLTEAFWQRIDYFLASAQASGLTVFLNAIGYDSDFTNTGPLSGKSSSEFTAYGTALGNRYASQANLIWMVADDYFGEADSLITGFLTGLRSTSDVHPIAIENNPETTSRYLLDTGASMAWGLANAQFNFVYSYNQTYYGIEKAYAETSPVPVIQGDGYFYQGTGANSDRAIRQDAWWALTSGARGCIQGSENIWQWASTALSDTSNDGTQHWFASVAGKVRAAFESLTGWHLLLPDSSSQLVIAGRGTHASSLTSGGPGGQYEPAFTSSYVSASKVPDGSLAVIYMPNHATITIDQSKLLPGYGAKWLDPVTGATTAATVGGTYNSTTAGPGGTGTNSAGDPDWVLVLATPPYATWAVP
jgi:Protein of unknown function (DUF4038)/Putative collagen-binding domain of a collagenase